MKRIIFEGTARLGRVSAAIRLLTSAFVAVYFVARYDCTDPFIAYIAGQEARVSLPQFRGTRGGISGWGLDAPGTIIRAMEGNFGPPSFLFLLRIIPRCSMRTVSNIPRPSQGIFCPAEYRTVFIRSIDSIERLSNENVLHSIGTSSVPNYSWYRCLRYNLLW